MHLFVLGNSDYKRFGIIGYPVDSEAFSIAIYVRILTRDLISMEEERNRISAATRYATHLIELFAKESFYEKNIHFEKNKFLDFLIELKDETTNSNCGDYFRSIYTQDVTVWSEKSTSEHQSWLQSP